MKKLNIGVVGLGRVSSKTHIPVLRSLENVEVSVGAENNAERARRVKELFGFKKIYASYEDMYSSEHPDAVYVCLPTFLHMDACEKALNNGIHVLCEKPMGMSSKEADVISELAEAKGLVLMPGYKKRYASNFAKAKKMIEEGLLGKILHVQGTFITGGPYISWDPKSEWYLDERWHGVIYDVGCHIVDLLLYLLPFETRNMRAVAAKGFNGYNTPTNIACSFEMGDGILGDLAIGWRLSTDVVSLTVHGTAGSLTVSREEFTYANPGTDPVDKILAEAKSIVKDVWMIAKKIRDKIKGKDFYVEDLLQAKAFCKAVEGAAPPPVNGRSGVNVHRFLEQVVSSLDGQPAI